jgi:hypothetical protein
MSGIINALIGLGGGAQLFVEDVFSTYLYTGTGAAQTITNGINLSGQGGLVWIKSRSAATNNFLFDTTRGVNVEINSNTQDANVTLANSVTAFNSNGFAISSAAGIGVNAATYASWTFRELPKFFDVVTYTGDGTSGRTIAHNLGSVPGMIIIKRTDSSNYWYVWHRSYTGAGLYLNSAEVFPGDTAGFATSQSSTTINLAGGTLNSSGATYVAYLYAHDAGGFGASGTDSIISCGTYTGNGNASVQNINLGWEPQWILLKQSVVAGGSSGITDAWQIVDNMRGLVVGADDAVLNPNNASVENTNAFSMVAEPTATGWQVGSQANYSGATYIYVAIRRGPMKTPTLGTSVFSPVLSSSYPSVLTAGFPVDMALTGTRTTAGYEKGINDRLRGFSNTSTGTSPWLVTQTTAAETTNTGAPSYYLANNTTITVGTYFNGTTIANYLFQRAPGFFDEVCYTGTGANRTVNHNLGVVPELMIVKRRDSTGTWYVYAAPLGADTGLALNLTNAAFPGSNPSLWNITTPTNSNFTVGVGAPVNGSGGTFVNYLFASCPGVSKVGSYTGNGSSQTINCAFTTGSRFVMIKRTDSTGDWYVWDSARGIVAGNDPYIALNTTAAEVTSNDSVDTDNTGFIVNQDAASNVNVNAATYIFLAIA